MADQLAGPLPPLIHPTTSLEAAVRGNTLGIGYASGGEAGSCLLLAQRRAVHVCMHTACPRLSSLSSPFAPMLNQCPKPHL